MVWQFDEAPWVVMVALTPARSRLKQGQHEHGRLTESGLHSGLEIKWVRATIRIGDRPLTQHSVHQLCIGSGVSGV